MSVVSPQPQDPFQLERLAEELASRETSRPEYDEDTAHDLPEFVPLSHDNSYLTAETFDVEDFLLSRSHTSLQDLKTELRDYLSNLKEELVQLINDDYEAFISLSTDLKGEGTRLSNLKAPLAGLKQEIQISKSELYAIQDNIQEKLKKRAALREEKALLHLLLKISESVTRLESLLLISSNENAEMDDMPTLNPNDEHAEERGNRAKHLSRVAAEYTQLLYHANKARKEKCMFVDEIQWRIDRIQSTISSDLDHLFGTTLISLIEGKGEGEKTKLMGDLTECLKTYDVLGLWRDAEDVLRREVVRPFIKKTIFSGALNAPHSPLLPHTPFIQARTPFISSTLPPRTPYTPFTSKATLFQPAQPQGKGTSPYAPILEGSDEPIASLYSQILRFVERDLARIMDIAEKVSLKSLTSKKTERGIPTTPQIPVLKESLDTGAKEETRGFEVLANVIWEEFGRAIMDELGGVVFAAGRPNEFKQNHEITQAFIRSLEFQAPSLHSIESMRAHPIYVAFEKRWQLPVYFQMRWKEIVGRVEEGLSTGQVGFTEKSATETFKTTQASDIWIAVTACWSAEVFIPELSHRLWKLTLQLFSRYKRWLEETVIQTHTTRPSAIVNEKIAASRSSTPVPQSEPTPAENVAADDAALRRCAAVITDIRVLQKSAMALWNDEISMMLPKPEDEDTDSAGAEDALRVAFESLGGLVAPLSKIIVSTLTKRACDALLPVRSIPSQLRAMSNKRPPSDASPFIGTIMRPVKLFFGTTGTGDAIGASLKEEFLVQYASEVFDEVAQKYISYIAAIKKAEESLKRFKVGRKKTFSLFGSKDDENQEGRDEERIRVQIILDIEAFEKDGRSLGVELDDSQSFKALNELAKNTEPVVPET
ncbi:hypothetical protein V5O48_007005 [Marasmius crinis-equi]|uniref:Conserved oligomeric Golgi complex subunit 2 n=1 Tax=Marasmius crinis-equi TaxID=585013 RepID=A0ABR3FHW0_9AGAR